MNFKRILKEKNIAIPIYKFEEDSIEPDANIVAWTGYAVIYPTFKRVEQKSAKQTLTPFPSIT
jgi:hypothetical protein